MRPLVLPEVGDVRKLLFAHAAPDRIRPLGRARVRARVRAQVGGAEERLVAVRAGVRPGAGVVPPEVGLERNVLNH